jgi:Domain of unknown function (DUF6438)
MLRTITCRVIASIAAFLCGCGVSLITRPVQTLPPPASHTLEISAITLKHQGCTDAELKCPVYDVTFRSDGTATYVGYANDDFIGTHTATYPKEDFANIARYVEQEHFFAMPSAFQTGPVEETIVFQVDTSEGSRAVTTYNWPSTPAGLRTLHALVYHLVYQVEWDEVEQ